MIAFIRPSLATLLLALAWNAHATTIPNGGFESGLDGWRPLWTRGTNGGRLMLDSAAIHSGVQSGRIEPHGEKDWALEPALRVSVQAGDVFEFGAWLKLDSRDAAATLCVSTHKPQGQTLDWSYGGRSLHSTADWQRVRRSTVFWFDLDGDGWDDLIIGTGRGGRLGVFRNDRLGVFTAMTSAPFDEPVRQDLTTILGWHPQAGSPGGRATRPAFGTVSTCQAGETTAGEPSRV